MKIDKRKNKVSLKRDIYLNKYLENIESNKEAVENIFILSTA